jgi:hypothetical protein
LNLLKYFYTVCLISFTWALSAQTTVTGTLVDAQSNEPILGAVISTTQNTGNDRPTIKPLGNSDLNGNFSVTLPAGARGINFSAFGYATRRENLQSTAGVQVNLGILKMELDASMVLQQADVVTDGPAMLNGLDRKVYDVSGDLQVASGTGTDILRQVPNVTLDIDGNVALRGDENVTILIDGRPASLMGYQGTNAFDRLPAGMVQKVEVITNPGAKFDAQGTGGIINIVTKKGRELPLNGAIQAGIGTRNKYNLGGNVSVPVGKVRINASIGADDRQMTSGGYTYRTYYFPDSTYLTSEESVGLRHDVGTNARFGLDWTILDKHMVGFSFGMDQRSGTDWDSTTYINTGKDGVPAGAIQYKSESSERANQNLSFRYERKFADENKKWTADANYSWGNDHDIEDNFFTTDPLYPTAFTFGAYLQRFDVPGNSKRLNLQSDVEWPISEKARVDFGWRTSSSANVEVRAASQLLEPVSSSFLTDTLRSFFTDMSQLNHAAYATYGYVFSPKWKGQIGMRYETALVNIVLKDSSTLQRSYPGLFPSAYLTYSPRKGLDLQASYSMRVNRPDGHWGGSLNPNIDYSNPSGLRKGNPDLKPEYTHSMEFNVVQFGRWGSISGSAYGRHTINMMSRYMEALPSGVLMMTWLNFNTRDNVGLSTNAMLRFNKNVQLQASADAFYSVINGTNVSGNLTQGGFGWQGRSNLMLNLPKEQQIQITYNQWGTGPTGQGFRRGIQFIDLGYKVDFMNKHWTLSARLSDVFNQRRFRYDQFTEILDIEFMRRRESRIGFLTLQYNFGKPDRSRGGRGGRPGGMGQGMDMGGDMDM